MEIVTLYHPVEMVHNNQNQILTIIHIIQDHNHPTIIETEIAHDDRSQEIDSATFGNTLIHC